MSVSVSINGRRATDGKLLHMANLAIQCRELGVDYPPQLVEYFSGTDALDIDDVEGIMREAIEVDLQYDLEIPGLLHGEAEYGDGALIDLTKLPKDIVALRIHMC
tara:strand:+ start:5681 stop:5995 length:315 start_codon:yes stop_codon:yes gene_type:complete